MLTDLAIRKAKPREKDYKLSDSGGLYLFVAKTGRLSWRLKYRFSGKERRLILGSYPLVALNDARRLREAAKLHLAEGRDPGVEAQKEKIQRAAAAACDFETLGRGWYELQRPRWTKIHAGDVIGSLEKEVFPWLGRLAIKDIDEPLILTVLRKIERRGAIETAHRVRQRISAVFVHAIAEGVATRDPAAVVTKALKPVPKSKKRPALINLEELQDMLRKTECEPASPVTKLGSRFMALTAQRPGMVRSLPWTEIEGVDWETHRSCPDALWRVPASRMKLILELKSDDAFDHIVPLQQQAVKVLRAVHRLTGNGPLVFPSSRHSHVPMSENTVNYFYNRCGYQGRHVPHGWRASFSTIMNEWARLNGNAGDRHVIDLMLAHVPEGVSGSENVYNRAAYMERRSELAAAWADMLMGGLAEPEKLLFGPRR
ncbi:MAG: integrase arm-type DNA-binding domain-containing protein [Sphingorhabdus sp.]